MPRRGKTTLNDWSMPSAFGRFQVIAGRPANVPVSESALKLGLVSVADTPGNRTTVTVRLVGASFCPANRGGVMVNDACDLSAD